MIERTAGRKLLVVALVVATLLIGLFVTLRPSVDPPGGRQLPREQQESISTPIDSSRPAALESAARVSGSEAMVEPAKTSAHQRSESVSPSISGNGDVSQYADASRWRKTPIPCWGLRGTAPEDFIVTADTYVHTAGDSSASLASVRATFGWGTLYQFVSADALRGKRIEFSADIRTADVRYGANLFVRMDDADGSAVAMDNMYSSYAENGDPEQIVNRRIAGDNEWSTHRIVLEVPASAAAISYGVALFGQGQVWIDNALLEAVDGSTRITSPPMSVEMLASTGKFSPIGVAATPRNLSFETAAAGAACH
jgi:hypothetical protein